MRAMVYRGPGRVRVEEKDIPAIEHPNDAIVRMVYGNYLLKAGQMNDAVEQLQAAADLDPENPTNSYNAGLEYIQKKDYDKARIHAKRAYELGFPLPGLKNQLIKAGKWDE